MSDTQSEPYPLVEPEASLGDLVSRLGAQMGDLVQNHIELAKVEIVDEVRTASKGAGLLGGGALAGWFALLLLSFAAAWGLDEVMPTGFAFLIVGVVWGVVAAVLALMGRSEIQRVDPVPRETTEVIKEDAQWVKEQTN